MSQRPGARLLTVVLPLTAVLAAAPAHAERAVTSDAAGDVFRVTYTADPSDPVLTPAPEEASVDVTRTVVDHRAARLTVGVGFRDLVRLPWMSTDVRVRTPQGTYSVTIDREPGEATETTLSRRSRTIECPGLRSSTDHGTDRLTVSVPTSCVDAPRWVQVGVGVVSFGPDESTPDPEDLMAVVDDGHRSGAVTEQIALGQRVRRG